MKNIDLIAEIAGGHEGRIDLASQLISIAKLWCIIYKISNIYCR